VVVPSAVADETSVVLELWVSPPLEKILAPELVLAMGVRRPNVLG
jgi:hypothetical protein